MFFIFYKFDIKIDIFISKTSNKFYISSNSIPLPIFSFANF